MQSIIQNNGKITPCKLRKDGKLSPHLWAREIWDEGDFLLAGILILVFEDIRAQWGHPILVNSGYRSVEKQKRLIEYYRSIGKPNQAASRSPHCEGMALDLNCEDRQEVQAMLSVIRKVRETKHPYLRIGWKQYLQNGYNFIHIDVCPYFFNTESGVFKTMDVPATWRDCYAEW